MRAFFFALALLQAGGGREEAVRPAPPAELMRTVARLAQSDPERAASIAAWAVTALEARSDVEPAEPAEPAEPVDNGATEAPALFDVPGDDRAAAKAWASDVLRTRTRPDELDALKAEFRHAEGVARFGQERFDAASGAFEAALALAGPGELRLAAAYNSGTAKLASAERLRADFLAAEQQSAAPPVPGAPPAAGAAAPLDPIPALRAAYLAAKAELIERLRLDFEHEDTRANLELAQRRLRELDEMERQQEEQQKQQEEQQNQEGEEKDEGQEGEAGEDGEPSDSEQKPEDRPGSEDENEPPAEQEQNPAEPTEPPEAQSEPAAPPAEATESAERPPAERVLSREEVMHLLDQLKRLEGEAQALQALLRESRRVPVEKDW